MCKNVSKAEHVVRRKGTVEKEPWASCSEILSILPVNRWASRVELVVKNPPANTGDVRDTGSVPGSGRSPGGGRDNLASVLACRIPWTGEAGRVCGVTQRQTTGVTAQRGDGV